MAEQRPRILYFKDFLPTSVCIGLSMFFAMVFQFNGGVFLPAATQMSSALGCIQEDVTMAGYASFIGMTMHLPDSVPSEGTVYYPLHFHDGLSGTDCLQPDYHAHGKYLPDDLRMLCVGILPHVGDV